MSVPPPSPYPLVDLAATITDKTPLRTSWDLCMRNFRTVLTATQQTTLNIQNLNPAAGAVVIGTGTGFTTLAPTVVGQFLVNTVSGVQWELLPVDQLYQANGDGVTVAFAIGFTPHRPAGLLVFVGGLIQRLTTDYSYSASPPTITFTSAPPAGTNNVQVSGAGN